MYWRLIILSVIIVSALCGLSVLGYHAVEKWAEGLEGARLGEFAEVAEQIRQDVKQKLDDFLQTEQDRPYTDYNYYYVPENVALVQQEQTQMPLFRSPLAGRLDNNLISRYCIDRTIDRKNEIFRRNNNFTLATVSLAPFIGICLIGNPPGIVQFSRRNPLYKIDLSGNHWNRLLKLKVRIF